VVFVTFVVHVVFVTSTLSRIPETAMAATAITADQVKQLRDKTGAGMMECKAALNEANGNMEEAITILRKRGLAQAAKRAGRATAQGLIGSYIHMGGKIGVLVEVNCETDFVARTDDFQNLVKEVAMHIAAADPKWVRREDVPADAIEKEKSIYRAQMENTGKPAHVLDKIIEGKLVSFYSQFVLLDQPSIRDNNVTIGQLITQASRQDRGEHPDQPVRSLPRRRLRVTTPPTRPFTRVADGRSRFRVLASLFVFSFSVRFAPRGGANMNMNTNAARRTRKGERL
jgi:elongation factor Ts